MTAVLRFAPSPNGYLHLGHAFSALLNAEMAQTAGGRLLLRIEDIDMARCRPEFEAAIFDDLHWLGLSWETPVRRQSEHFDAYRAALARLDSLGLIYPSFETRGEIALAVAAREAGAASLAPWPRDPDGAPLYPGMGKRLTADERAILIASGRPYALRLDMAAALARTGPLDWTETSDGAPAGSVAADPAAWGDVVLARKDLPTSYHLSVTVDDATQEITHVVRGRDLYAATAVQRVLQALLGFEPPVYHHHRLILDEASRKLSKSSDATALRVLRAQGASPASIRRSVGL